MKSHNKALKVNLVLALSSLIIISINFNSNKQAKADPIKTQTETLNLAKPYDTKSAKNFTKVLGWDRNRTPIAPTGFKVTKFAGGLTNPRNIYQSPNGDILISEANTEVPALLKIGADIFGVTKAERLEKSVNRITLFRDTNNDGIPDIRTTFLKGLNQPYGMLIMNNYFYVANTDGLWRYPYKTGDTVISSKGQKILTLPKGGLNIHWVRNLLANKDKNKIYISVGSGSNAGEGGMQKEVRRANIIEINPDGSGERIYASGLRNPVGMDWEPKTKSLWVAVNERDELGDELVPDYATNVKEGGFYGWPYSYYGQNIEPRIDKKDQRLDLVKKATIPDVPLGSHTASLGLAFYKGKSFPEKYRDGMFIGQHGSWNKSQIAGYKVVFVPFVNGKPSAKPEDFLTGFIADAKKNIVYGRPVDVEMIKDGSLLVSDDRSNVIWRITYSK